MPFPYVALLIGGALPACLWGITAIFQKLSTQHDLAPGPFLVAFGAMIVIVGGILCIVMRGSTSVSLIGLRFAFMAGLTYAIATGLISFALLRFGVPIAKLAPILGCNVLVTVLIGILWLGEGEGLNVWKIIGGTAVVFAGLTLVTAA